MEIRKRRIISLHENDSPKQDFASIECRRERIAAVQKYNEERFDFSGFEEGFEKAFPDTPYHLLRIACCCITDLTDEEVGKLKELKQVKCVNDNIQFTGIVKSQTTPEIPALQKELSWSFP